MARLTEKKMERWEKDLRKAYEIVVKTRQEMFAVQASAVGGRLAVMNQLVGEANELGSAFLPVAGALKTLAVREANIKAASL